MIKQPEALRLADALDDIPNCSVFQMREAAAELRRLHNENKLLHERRRFDNGEFVRLHEANQAMLEALKTFVALANETHDHWDNDRNSKVGKMLLALSGENQRYDKRIDEIHAAIAKGEKT